MKKKIMAIVFGIGMGMSFVGPALAATCADYYNECVAGGTDVATCERLYQKCITFGWDGR